jgi:hypothetical protein
LIELKFKGEKMNVEINDLNLEEFGIFLDRGVASAVINPYMEYNYSEKLVEPLLMITREKEKFLFLQELIPGLIEELNCEMDEDDYDGYDSEEEAENDFSHSFKGYLKHIKEDMGYDIFYMEKMEKHYFNNIDTFDKIVSYIGEGLAAYGLHPEEINEDLSLMINEELKEDEEAAAIQSSLVNAMYALKNMEPKDGYSFDIHEGQFLSYKGNIICTDIALF